MLDEPPSFSPEARPTAPETSALGQWIESNGLSIVGPCREVFLEPPFQDRRPGFLDLDPLAEGEGVAHGHDAGADSDEAGHPFRHEGGHAFRGEGGHPVGACGEQGSWWIEVAALRPATAL